MPVPALPTELEKRVTKTVSPPAAVSAEGLYKAFDGKAVLDGVELTVASGTVFALLGPNGAGKTTMVNIFATLLEADAGQVHIAGHDLARDPDGVRSAIGVTGQFSAVDDLLTGEENLRLIADLRHLGREHGRRRVNELLEHFELTDAARRPVSTYSGGMKRRLDLAMTLLGDPQLIFLDEPTTGLDPRSRRGMWDVIGELVSAGVTIFLTTQYLEEADRLADRVAVLDHGRIVAEGSPDELKRRVPGGHIRLHFPDPQTTLSAAHALGSETDNAESATLKVPGDGSPASLRDLLGRLGAAGIEPDRLSIHDADLDDVFLALTGHPTSEPETER
ncbi:MAG TPA: ATP-binding cassette domain-containing protein [Solirubrobacteraceae bacterium]|nr:ATP-binding cassette domain-containing protein [Solirubrobacteraceae bacterium]